MIIVVYVTGKTVLITGAARRLGAAVARSFHAAGFRVAVHYHTSEKAAYDLVETFNATRSGSAIAIQCDLTARGFADGLLGKLADVWGQLNVLVNNASIYEPSDLQVADSRHFERVIAANLAAPYHLSTGCVDMLRATQGAIVNLADIYGERPQAGYAVYCASKAGLIGLTKSLALDLSPDVRVNAVSPGPILWADGDQPAHRQEVLKKTPLGRLGTPRDIADAVYYLATAPYVTGQILAIDGGRSIFI